MKILHTSDWHLGKFVSVQSMIDDQRYFIENVFLRALDEYEPDVIVLAGDIYDRSIAPVAAITLLQDTLYAVAQRGIPLVAISGNHDSADRLLPAAKLMCSAGIHLANSMEDFLQPVDITGKDGISVRFFLLPYFDLPTAKFFIGNEELKSPDDAYAALFEMAQEKLAADRPNILVTHCTVAGAVTCDSESSLLVGGVQQVSSDRFGAFDFTCLGHIHSPQKAGKAAMYSGSPLRYSFDPNERDKCMLLIETNGMSVTRIPIRPRREMRVLRGTFEELLDVPDNCSEDYISALVTDERLIYEPMARLRQKYPHILELKQDYLRRTLSQEGDRGTLREKMANHTITDEEIMTSFLRDVCRTEPLPDDVAFFAKINTAIGEDDQ